MSSSKYTIDMTSGPMLGKIIKFSVPLILTGVLQLLFNAADMIVVGNFGSDNSLAAVGATGALINLIVNVFMGLSVGASVVVANAIGAGKSEKASNAAHTALLISFISGIIVGIFGVLTSKTWLILMGTPDDVIELSAVYIRYYFAGMPVMMLFNFGASILRAMGDTKRPLYFLSLSGVLNVILNLIFVILLKMDVAGVALATVITQGIAAALVVICLIKSDTVCKINIKKLKIHWKELWEIAKIGLPAGIQGSIFSISNVLIQSSVNSFGSVVMSGNTAASSIEGFIYTSMNALYQAAITFTGQNFGAKKYKRINKVCLQCLLTVAVIGIVGGVITYAFAGTLIGIYDSDPVVIGYGIRRTSIIAVTYFICGMMDVMVGILRGLGKSVTPMFVSIIGVCGIRVLWIYTIFAQYRTLEMLYISYPISWIVTFAIHFISFLIVRRKYPKEDVQTEENAKA